MILFIDNYDSFTYNLVDIFGQFYSDVRVERNNTITPEAIASLAPDGIVISPGPGTPQDAGISCRVIERFYQKIPILGVCLGHQCIGEVFGARVIRGPAPVHGKTSEIHHDGSRLFREINSPFTATRYHSLIIEEETLPPELRRTAWTEDGIIMGIQHREAPLYGVQFHPESILTRVGPQIIRNWLELIPQGMKQHPA